MLKCFLRLVRVCFDKYMYIGGGVLGIPAGVYAFYPQDVYHLWVSAGCFAISMAYAAGYCHGGGGECGDDDKNYNYKCKSVTVRSEICQNGDLLSKQIRRLEAISSVSYVWFADSSADRQCRVFTRYNVSASIRGADSSVIVNMKKKNNGTYEGKLAMSPPIQSGIIFDIDMEFERGGCIPMTYEEVASTVGKRLDFSDEAVAFVLYAPPAGIDVLDLKYEFPQGFVPKDIRPRVCYRKEFSDKETSRARNGFVAKVHGGRLVVEWVIKSPLDGHGYFVTWVPPNSAN